MRSRILVILAAAIGVGACAVHAPRVECDGDLRPINRPMAVVPAEAPAPPADQPAGQARP